MSPELDAHSFALLAESMHHATTPTQTAEEAIDFAQQQMDADMAGITLIRTRDRLQTIAPTDDVVCDIDRLQYDLAQGPCRESSWHENTLLSEDIANDPRWPQWGPRAAELGVASVLAIALSTADEKRIGAVNLYWDRPRDFSRDDVAFAHVFARHATLALAASLEEANLNVALDGRKRIGQAQGILMERFQLNEEQAFAVLRRYSQDHNLKLRNIAESLVATRRLPSDGTPAASVPDHDTASS